MTHAAEDVAPQGDGQSQHDRPSVRLYLKNVPFKAVELEVGAFCEAVAPGASAYEVVLPREPKGKRRPQGIAFVTLILPLGADERLWEQLDGRYMAGRKITVQLERGRSQRNGADNEDGIDHGKPHL